MKYEEFLIKVSKEEFKEYIEKHTVEDCLKYFDISRNVFYKIKNYFKLNTISQKHIDIFIRNLDREEFEKYYNTHSDDEIFEKYGKFSLNDVLKRLYIRKKKKQRKK